MNQNNTEKLSSVEVLRTIDSQVSEYDKYLLQKDKEKMMKVKFSGVDNHLNKICELNELMSRSMFLDSSTDTKCMSFDKIKDYLTTKGKKLQLISSKCIAEKLTKKKPKQESTYTQVLYQ